MYSAWLDHYNATKVVLKQVCAYNLVRIGVGWGGDMWNVGGGGGKAGIHFSRNFFSSAYLQHNMYVYCIFIYTYMALNLFQN